MVACVSEPGERDPRAGRLAAAILGLRLRADSVEHFLRAARLSPDRTTLAALHYHALALRLRAESAHADMEGNADSGRPSV